MPQITNLEWVTFICTIPDVELLPVLEEEQCEPQSYEPLQKLQCS